MQNIENSDECEPQNFLARVWSFLSVWKLGIHFRVEFELLTFWTTIEIEQSIALNWRSFEDALVNAQGTESLRKCTGTRKFRSLKIIWDHLGRRLGSLRIWEIERERVCSIRRCLLGNIRWLKIINIYSGNAWRLILAGKSLFEVLTEKIQRKAIVAVCRCSVRSKTNLTPGSLFSTCLC